MIEIQLFSIEVLDALGSRLDGRMVDEVARNVAHGAYSHWVKQVKESNLVTTKRAYLDGLQRVARRGAGEYVVSLVGRFPMILEAGQKGYDMRTTLLGPSVPVVEAGAKGSGKRKTKKGGFYRSVPFGHAGSEASGAGGVSPMGRAYEGTMAVKDAKRLGRDVYGQAKELKAYATSHGQLQGAAYRAKGPRGAYVPVPTLTNKNKTYTHQTNIYEGMIRQAQKGGGSSYTTFRSISTTGGDPASWIRPTTKGIHLATKVSAHVARTLPEAFKSFAAGIGT